VSATTALTRTVKRARNRPRFRCFPHYFRLPRNKPYLLTPTSARSDGGLTMRGKIIGLLMLALGAGCAEETTESSQALSPELQYGRDIWFNETFGGEKFFTFIVSGPPFNLHLALDAALTSPRATRFNEYGLINDPDCVPGDASTFGFDKC